MHKFLDHCRLRKLRFGRLAYLKINFVRGTCRIELKRGFLYIGLFCRESYAILSRNVSAKSDLTAGEYIDSNFWELLSRLKP